LEKESPQEHLLKLIDGCSRGRKDSQYALYRYFYGFAMSICLRFANDRQDASAILNEGFFKIFTRISSYDPDKPMESWIATIMKNTAIDYYRLHLRFNGHDDINNHQHLGTEAVVYSRLAYQDLLVLIQQLTPAYRTVFNLYAIDGHTHEEIAVMLGITVGTSKSNLFKARLKLQEMLRTYDKHGTREGMDRTNRINGNDIHLNTDK
jgi:RNA polymerase sigma factor (sigma-70 family)